MLLRKALNDWANAWMCEWGAPVVEWMSGWNGNVWNSQNDTPAEWGCLGLLVVWWVKQHFINIADTTMNCCTCVLHKHTHTLLLSSHFVIPVSGGSSEVAEGGAQCNKFRHICEIFCFEKWKFKARIRQANFTSVDQEIIRIHSVESVLKSLFTAPKCEHHQKAAQWRLLVKFHIQHNAGDAT